MSRRMKDSGIEWIGEIPEDWEVYTLSKIASIKTGSTPDNKILNEECGLDWVKTNNLNEEKGVNNSKQKISLEKKHLVPIAKKGSTLVSCIGDIGKMAYITKPVSYNQQINSVYFKDNNIYPKFGFYSLYTQKEQHKSLSNGNVLHILNSVNHGFVKLTFPGFIEQKAISNFLDVKTRKIEDAKKIIKKEIKTLENYKKSIITEAVTKGLDKNVEMKDSGIEWIGKIPKHWVKSKVKNACSIIGSGTTPESGKLDYYSDNGYYWIQSGDLYNIKTILNTEKRVSNKALKKYTALEIYESPFLVMAMYGASVGNLSISTINAATNQACCVLKTNESTSLIYLYYWLSFCKDNLIRKAEGGSQPNISQEKIKNEIMYFPTLKEQKLIADYLDQKCQLIDDSISIKKQQLEKLEEYKKSLIYEYVTGKKEVKDV